VYIRTSEIRHLLLTTWYGDGANGYSAGKTAKENSRVFSLIRMR